MPRYSSVHFANSNHLVSLPIFLGKNRNLDLDLYCPGHASLSTILLMNLMGGFHFKICSTNIFAALLASDSARCGVPSKVIPKKSNADFREAWFL